jgi:hypothetical protein
VKAKTTLKLRSAVKGLPAPAKNAKEEQKLFGELDKKPLNLLPFGNVPPAPKNMTALSYPLPGNDKEGDIVFNVKCRNLPRMDGVFQQCDPIVLLYTDRSSEVISATEYKKQTSDADFEQTLHVPLSLAKESKIQLYFMVYDVDEINGVATVQPNKLIGGVRLSCDGLITGLRFVTRARFYLNHEKSKRNKELKSKASEIIISLSPKCRAQLVCPTFSSSVCRFQPLLPTAIRELK